MKTKNFPLKEVKRKGKKEVKKNFPLKEKKNNQ